MHSVLCNIMILCIHGKYSNRVQESHKNFYVLRVCDMYCVSTICLNVDIIIQICVFAFTEVNACSGSPSFDDSAFCSQDEPFGWQYHCDTYTKVMT